MTDIVERLRGFRPPVSGIEVCTDAAAEIERLRAALRLALPVLEDVSAGGRTLTPIKKRQEARAAVSFALGSALEQ